MTVLEEDDEQAVLVYHTESGPLNERFPDVDVRGDGIVALLSRRSGIELSMPDDVPIHLAFA